jgi:hypothetical protein
MAEQSNKLNLEKAGEENDLPKVARDRRKFAQGLATAMGLTAVVASPSVMAGESRPAPEQVKSKILQQIQKDLADTKAGTDCYDRGPAGDHYLRGSCVTVDPVEPIEPIKRTP